MSIKTKERENKMIKEREKKYAGLYMYDAL